MTSGPMPSPPITAMRKAAIAGDLQIFYSPVAASADLKILTKSQSRRRGKRVNMERTREAGKKQEEGIAALITSACLPLFLGTLPLLGGCSTWQKLTGSGPTAQA